MRLIQRNSRPLRELEAFNPLASQVDVDNGGGGKKILASREVQSTGRSVGIAEYPSSGIGALVVESAQRENRKSAEK